MFSLLNAVQMSAWTESDQVIKINDIDKKFEDDFAPPQSENEFKKLDDSDDYLKLLGKYFK